MTAIIALTLSTAALLLAAYGAMRIAKIVEMTANLLPHIANVEAKLSEAKVKDIVLRFKELSASEQTECFGLISQAIKE